MSFVTFPCEFALIVCSGKADFETKQQLKKLKEDAKEAADAVRRRVNITVRKPLFTAVLDAAVEVPILTAPPALGCDWDAPWLLQAPDGLKLCMAEPAVANAMTAWGGQYQRILERQKMDLATHPMSEKNGRDEVNRFFLHMVPESQLLDLKEVPGGEAFATSAWLFGCSRKMATVVAAPNHACMFKALVCGEVRSFLIEVTKLRDFLEHSTKAEKNHHLKDTLKLLEDFTREDLDKLIQFGAKVYYVVQKKNDVLFIPPLFFHMEVARVPEDATNGSTLIYGCRKSFFMKRFAKDYELALGWMQQTGSERMQQILKLMKA